MKIEGKVFRESLNPEVFTIAKRLLGDFIKKKRKRAANSIAGTFADAQLAYEKEVDGVIAFTLKQERLVGD